MRVVRDAAAWLRRIGPRPLRQQIVLLTAGATALAVVLLAVVLQLVLGRLASDDVARVTHDRAVSVIASLRVSSSDVITVPPAQLSAGVAVYASGGTLVDGAPPENLREDYSRLRLTDRARTVSRPDRSRIEARPFRRNGTTGVVIVSEPFAPYEEAERLALIVSIVTGLLTVLMAAAVAAWATRRALRPVEVMARTAAEWSEHDLGRRFVGDGGSRRADELGELARTLDGLLDRVSAAIRSEQRLTAELAHELRTPLTAIRGEADLALLRDAPTGPTREALERIVTASTRMAQTIATLLELARAEGTIVAASRCSLTEVVAEVLSEVGLGPPGAGAASTTTVDVAVDEVRLALPHALAVRALSPVVENAARFAERRVRVASVLDGSQVRVLIEDDGPGVAAERADAVFEPGITSAAAGHGSAGLGLAIARRVARTSGGDVVVAADSRAGASRFEVRLPVAGVPAVR